ncbi:MAG TPA: DNA repair protein RecN [Euzebya sp.]|nr:DNA repair protein RecN [Euzebya sp.]
MTLLTDLEITDLGIIDHISLALAPGLNVLTGETGAGKTMVVSGLQWLLGGRADRDRVRQGAKAALVQARFEGLPPSAVDWVDPDDQELLVSREVGAKGDSDQAGGRSRARLAGRLAPVTTLGEVLGPVVEVHSQHESVRLGDPSVQRRLLDRFDTVTIGPLIATYQDCYGSWRSASAAVLDAEQATREDVRQVDRLRTEIAEISGVAPQVGEEDRLDADIDRLQHAESLRLAATTAAEALTAEAGARDTLGMAVAALREVAMHDDALRDPLGRLEAVSAEAQEVAFDLVAYADGLDGDPQSLQEILGRRAAIGALLRKFGPGTADVLEYLAQAQQRLDLIDGGEERLAVLRDARDQAQLAVHAAGTSLRRARLAAGKRLAAEVDGHLRELAMADARTRIEVAEAEPGPDGADRVEFLLAANRGQPALPLGRAASGGERSRVALAVKVALADADDTPVMVFDEVDAGIGGETALAVGRKLARLAQGRQVLCVTHLAQLAAFADAHFVVSKHVRGNTTVTEVVQVDDAERAAELSRMLSGTAGSQAALSHARELLTVARAGS